MIYSEFSVQPEMLFDVGLVLSFVSAYFLHNDEHINGELNLAQAVNNMSAASYQSFLCYAIVGKNIVDRNIILCSNYNFPS